MEPEGFEAAATAVNGGGGGIRAPRWPLDHSGFRDWFAVNWNGGEGGIRAPR